MATLMAGQARAAREPQAALVPVVAAVVSPGRRCAGAEVVLGDRALRALLGATTLADAAEDAVAVERVAGSERPAQDERKRPRGVSCRAIVVLL